MYKKMSAPSQLRLLLIFVSFLLAVMKVKETLSSLSSPPTWNHHEVGSKREPLPSFYFKKSWPDGQVIYEISPDFNKTQKASILHAMEQLSLKTCIAFKKRTSEKDYLIIKMNHGVGCRTEAHREPGKVQLMTLDPSWCLTPGRLLHELMHSLGFTHEHQRPDRDKFIVIMWNNIKDEEKNQFSRKGYPMRETRGFKYDYTSILHYANWSEHAAIDVNKPIILPRKDEPNMGQRIGLDALDVEKVNLFYECNHRIK